MVWCRISKTFALVRVIAFLKPMIAPHEPPLANAITVLAFDGKDDLSLGLTLQWLKPPMGCKIIEAIWVCFL
jgi:hypothetical protein